MAAAIVHYPVSAALNPHSTANLWDKDELEQLGLESLGQNQQPDENIPPFKRHLVKKVSQLPGQTHEQKGKQNSSNVPVRLQVLGSTLVQASPTSLGILNLIPKQQPKGLDLSLERQYGSREAAIQVVGGMEKPASKIPLLTASPTQTGDRGHASSRGFVCVSVVASLVLAVGLSVLIFGCVFVELGVGCWFFFVFVFATVSIVVAAAVVQIVIIVIVTIIHFLVFVQGFIFAEDRFLHVFQSIHESFVLSVSVDCGVKVVVLMSSVVGLLFKFVEALTYRTSCFLWLPDQSGILIMMTNGKMAVVRTPNQFTIQDPDCLDTLCLDTRDCALCDATLAFGRLFVFFNLRHGPANPHPHADSDVFVREFENCLKELDMFNGETLYGFRIENAICAALERESDVVIMVAGKWHTANSARHYSQFAIAAAQVGNGQNLVTTTHKWLTNIAQYLYFH
ncbi:hypothetical protein BDR26DRAFT_892740 [Obelidium mucronatum]|nr:hypothetical protein BDR26DRAFT_892740 [Obelidium mucronatum]